MDYHHHWQHSMSAMLLSDSTAYPNFSRNFASWPWEFFYLLFDAMSTNVIKKSLYVSFIFAHLFCSRGSFIYVISVNIISRVVRLPCQNSHFVVLHCESLFLPSHWLSPPSIQSTRWKRCEWESNHCESLGDASKVPVAAVILVAPESRGLNAQTTSSFKPPLLNMWQYSSTVHHSPWNFSGRWQRRVMMAADTSLLMVTSSAMMVQSARRSLQHIFLWY